MDLYNISPETYPTAINSIELSNTSAYKLCNCDGFMTSDVQILESATFDRLIIYKFHLWHLHIAAVLGRSHGFLH